MTELRLVGIQENHILWAAACAGLTAFKAFYEFINLGTWFLRQT